MELQTSRLGVIHLGQFGSIRRRSAVDAVATLVTLCEQEWSKGRCVGALCVDVQAAFPSVNPRCLTSRLRECGVDEDLVQWTRGSMSDRTVQMVGDKEQAPLDATSGLPQGSPIPPLLFALYMGGVHEYMDQQLPGVTGLSFVDDITWIASGRSVREISEQLSRASRLAIRWGQTNAATFEIRKTEAILLSRSRRHWRDKINEGVRVGDQTIPYNRRATRWLGIWIDSRLSFRENTIVSAARVKKAETRLASFVRRNGVPPLSARHLQEVIIGSTLMYGSEVTWRGQAFMRVSIQRAINRMSRSSLGVLRSTPIAFLEAFGGSMLVVPRLDMRQAAYVGRVTSAEAEGIRAIAPGGGALAVRLRGSLQDVLGPDQPTQSGEGVGIETTSAPRGLRFPGTIRIPGAETKTQTKEERANTAIEFARGFETDPRSSWTDGSALPGGVGAAAVVGFVEGHETDQLANRVIQKRVGTLENGLGSAATGKGKRGKTYGQTFRSFRHIGSER